MKVKTLEKMYFKKTIIAEINQITSDQLKGGTRSFNGEKTGYATHCGDVVCY